jgi:hypothetical protein
MGINTGLDANTGFFTTPRTNIHTGIDDNSHPKTGKTASLAREP